MLREFFFSQAIALMIYIVSLKGEALFTAVAVMNLLQDILLNLKRSVC